MGNRQRRADGARVVTLVCVAFVIGLACGASRRVWGAAQPAPQVPVAPEPVTAASRDTTRVFTSTRGLILDFLKPGQATVYERTMKRVAEALATSRSNDRRRQAQGWRLYRASTPLDGGVLLYVSVLDPVVPGVDYWVPQILNEAFPTEVQELYDSYAAAFADGQMLHNLTLVYGE